jgi:hypothetical protein
MDGDTCPGVWVDDQYPDDVIVVGILLASSPVPLGPGETAVRLCRRTLADANLGV